MKQEIRVHFLLMFVLVGVAILSLLWEFGLEDNLFAGSFEYHTNESSRGKVECIISSLLITYVAMLVPGTLLIRAAKENPTLKGILPTCANCKNIRTKNGSWVQIETYIRDRSDAEFSHSICPECMKKLYPDAK